ncbi:MAG: guanylate kinase [Nitrospira sp.]|nr:guanylate kinase [Nitrospira sp.]
MQEKKSKGSLFIVSAPSGAGKTTLCRKLVSSLPNLQFSVSYTTRQPRKGEVNDRDYTFINRQDFRLMADKGELIEWAEVHGALYGTSRKRLEELLDSGNDVILDIDTQGAMQIKEKYKEGIYIFILPPSLATLKERLKNRLTDSKEEIRKRLGRAIAEIKTFDKYDYVIINDILEDALMEFEAVIISQRVSIKKINPLRIEESFLKQEEM